MNVAAQKRRWGSAQPVIWLTGFMGTGKSTAGPELARLLARPFLDTDRIVEEQCGCTVAELFALAGETAFRRRERTAIAQAAATPGAVVALGGGALLDPDNRRIVQATGPVLCLTARPETIVNRLGPEALAARPLLAGPDPAATIARMLSEREPVYRAADGCVATDQLEPAAVAAALARLLEERQWL